MVDIQIDMVQVKSIKKPSNQQMSEISIVNKKHLPKKPKTGVIKLNQKLY